VAWSNSGGAGVTFISMTEDDRKSLDVYLKSFPPEG